ncbi:glucose-methanol-choline oxidoreductase-like protein [Ampelomyces quisqualis]|uniref:Glucose-methanol-choline oxidoreductase-like protein n=1 Tax=Ampelomyces quisqualis TaxID=50730 RepID=A0A6A5R024_AMPQU|nr:glucose-methanol-choline oxidoreductase-like protein [Ampelomyces quisqualis]
MRFLQIIGQFIAFTSLASAVDLEGYEYVVVGSGAGGGPLAARLAIAGHKTLLIEAGDDQGANINYTVPAYNARVSEDPNVAWNFFVKHYADEERQARDFKTSYETPDGRIYTGLNPPANSHQVGLRYPRTGTLGGCTAHNALITVYPHQSDFNHIAELTGDDSWSASNMRQYFSRLEHNAYLLPGVKGHGYDGWLDTQYSPTEIVLNDSQLLSLVMGAISALGKATKAVFNQGSLVLGDVNADTETRDKQPAIYQIPLSASDGKRTGSREFVVAIRDAVTANGTKRFPLDVRTNCHVTKITFNQTATPPRANGVEFLDGQYLYKASPKSGGNTGTPGSATASREVIVAGGTYNSPQLLKLSGVGPAKELEQFDIPVVVDLPGVGTNLQDHYEISVQGKTPSDFDILDGCTFGEGSSDPCLDRWHNSTLGSRGVYASPGLGAAMTYKSSVAERDEFDVFLYGGPVNFRGYFPGYAYNATKEHDWFSWVLLKAHPRNTAGSVALQSSDPLDVPAITYNYFDTGAGEYEKDITALTEAIGLARDAFKRQPIKIDEVLPGKNVTSKEAIRDYVKDMAWGHHASSTCPIGADNDPMAVLDSSFRVRGTAGLRVVDASVFPRIPGTFTALSTYMVAEKAADVILSQLATQ